LNVKLTLYYRYGGNNGYSNGYGNSNGYSNGYGSASYGGGAYGGSGGDKMANLGAGLKEQHWGMK
jgi:ATP-dependent RNA helicase DDX5/DBP2